MFSWRFLTKIPRLQIQTDIEQDINICSMPSNVEFESAKPELQLELTNLKCNIELKQTVLNVKKIELYKGLSNSSFPYVKYDFQKIIAIFAPIIEVSKHR